MSDLGINADALLASGIGSKSECGVGEGVGEAPVGNAKTVGGCFGDWAAQGACPESKLNDFHVEQLAKGIVVKHALNNFFGAFHGLQISERKGVFEADSFFGLLHGATFIDGIVLQEQNIFIGSRFV